MHWLVDHPGPFYLLLGIVAVGFIIAFYFSRRVLHLGWAVGFVALMGLLWLLTRWVMTDRKQIETNIRTMAVAVVSGNTDQLFRYVARDFRFGTMDRDALYARVKANIQAHSINEITIFDFEAEQVSRPQRRARVSFKATVHTGEGPHIFLVRADFTLEDDIWKIAHMALFNPVVNTDQPIQIP